MGGFCFWGVRSLDDMVGYERVRWGDGGNAEPVYIFLICTVSNLQLLLTYDTSLSLVAHLATSIQPVSFYASICQDLSHTTWRSTNPAHVFDR